MSEPKVPAADHTLRILRLLARSRGPMPASIIASQLDLPRSSVYQLLATLQEHGFVMHLQEERRYGLGVAAVELSLAYEKQEPLARLGRPLVASLVDRAGASGHLAVPSGSDVLYVIEERAQGAPSLVTDVDVRLPMHLTASGRAILAVLPRAQVRALYPNAQAFAHRLGREGGIERYSQLRTVLDDTTTRGYAVERGSVTEGFSSVAVAVLDHRSWPVAAIALTFRDTDTSEDEYAALARQVQATADVLSTRIHGRRATPGE
ncbi:MAG: IclR family transcriptional regulator [Leucobacter sp.]